MKFKIDIPTDIEKPIVEDMIFLSKDANTKLTFNVRWNEFIGNSDIIQNLKNK